MSEINKALFTSSSNEWSTPQDLYDALNECFCFTLDPCCTHENAKCEKHYTLEENGLLQSWHGERVFMNPPYGKNIVQWVLKAVEESIKGALVVALLPARTDTKWWKNYVEGHADLHFLHGRLKFGGAKHSAPFPSVLAVYYRHFKLLGV